MKAGLKKVLLVLGGLFILFMLFAYYGNFSSGFRVGVPVKLSKKGVLVKTYEGQLNIGGLTSGEQGVIPTQWDFTVTRTNEDVFHGIESAMEQGVRAKLYYKEKYIKLPWRGDTKYFVYKVELMEE